MKDQSSFLSVKNLLFGTRHHEGDSDSQCSTVSREQITKSALFHRDSSRQTRRVHFQETATMIHPTNPVLEEEDCRALWYSAEEYQQFKKANSFIAKTLNRAEMMDCTNVSSYGNLLQELHYGCCDSDTEVSRVMSHKRQDLLHRLFATDASIARTGLERSVVTSIHRDKYQRRISLAHIVFDIQQCAFDELEDSGYNAKNVAQELAEECAKVSLPSRLFAHHLAVAQAAGLEHLK